MRIIGIGTDIVECARIGQMIQRHAENFLDRVYTPKEVAYCQKRKAWLESFAGRWAAKEAIMKALATGWRKGVRWRDIEVRSAPSGQPTVALGGAARELAAELRIRDIQLSISHCRLHAIAYAIAVGDDEAPSPKR